MKVLIADKFEAHGVDALKAAGCEVLVDSELKDKALAEAIKKHTPQVLVVRSTKVTGDMFDNGSSLKMVVRAGSGYDTIDVNAATERGVRVTNCPGMNSVAVAELTLGLMIALDRKIVDETDDLRRGVWNKKEYSKARGLKDSTLGIVGLGRIGYEVARRAKAFEMKLLYCDVIARPEVEKELGMRRVTFEDILRESDFVTVHVPGGGDTKHLIGAKELATMKPTAFVLNCSRGGVIDETALGEALKSNKLAGAALDVYEIEPGANDKEFKDPVAKVPHLYGTHHVGASTEQAQKAVADEAVRIIKTYKDTGQFLNCVNMPKAGG
ncbi:MAG: hydroxyacid dehydrogenase [Phycisphaerae bacterium]|nr:hydroxyacid dehydrogenase [Phycisphaerae bacterium]